jgi:hypothetical protein
MFTSIQKVHGGTHRAGNDLVLFTNRTAPPATVPTTL